MGKRVVRVKSVVRGHGGPRVEIPMDARGQSVDIGQKKITAVLFFFHAHGVTQSHCRDWAIEYHVNVVFE